ncbi:MAG: serine hydrolase [Anaerotignum sp.]|nr:serine hydrolase [Anaerotignum sp.]
MISAKRIIIFIVVIALGIAGLSLFLFRLNSSDNEKEETFTAKVQEYTKEKSDVKLTIGVLKEGKINYKVFGEDAKELEPVQYEYEIGSISKTFTASILSKAIADGRIDLNQSISEYLPLDSHTFYPTVVSLATHTSGYGEYPFSSSELSPKELEKIDTDFYENKMNIYQEINRADMLKMIKDHALKDEAYGWAYSNFGIAALGTILGEVYNTTYKELAEDFIKNDLGLKQTRLGNGTGNLSNYWSWNDDDTYFAAGGYVSTVTDLLDYAKLHLEASPDYLALSHKTYETFENEGFSMGLGWIIDPETNYIWHNGGTSSYQSFLGFDKEHNTAVVVLSNYAAKDGTKDEDALDIMGFTMLNSLSDEGCNENNVFEKP